MIEPNMADDIKGEQLTYCVWAAREYPNLTGIKQVDFGLGAHGPMSPVTPDVDAYVDITVHCDQGKIRKEADDVFRLIQQLCEIENYYS